MWVRNLGSLPKKFGGPKTSKFRISRFDREYLQTGTRYRRPENGIGNCNHSPTCVPNLVNFAPQTAKNRTLNSTHSIDFFGCSYLRVYVALPPKNSAVGREWPTLANVHLNNFLTHEIQKLGKKIWCTLADIDGISWGNCTKLSYLMCPLWGIKCPHLILGVLLPKNFGGKKRSFQLRSTTPFCDFNADISRLEQDIVDRKKGLHTPITAVYVYQIWWTLVHKRRNGTDRFQPTQNQLFRTLISQELSGVAS